MELFELALRDPGVGGINQQTGAAANPNVLAKLRKDLYVSYKRHDIANYLPEPPPPVVPAHNENVLFYEGESPSINQEDNDVEHVRIHAEFEGSELYKAMTAEAKNAHAEHVQAHLMQAQIKEEVARRQQELAASQQGGPNELPGVAGPEVAG